MQDAIKTGLIRNISLVEILQFNETLFREPNRSVAVPYGEILTYSTK